MSVVKKLIDQRIGQHARRDRSELKERARVKHPPRDLNERWATHFDRCRSCQSDERPHNANGFCTRCYQRVYYRANYARDPVEVEESRKPPRFSGRM